MFKKRALRVFGAKMEDVTGGREKIRNGGLHNLYSSRNITRENE